MICDESLYVAHIGYMSTIPFRSKLEPHFDFIIGERRKRQTWDTIAKALTAQGTPTTPQAVHAFIKRRLKRRYPLGAAPEQKLPPVTTRPRRENPMPEKSDVTEKTPSESEFASDPLTRPLKKKNRWNVID